jgi:hypothetical protein
MKIRSLILYVIFCLAVLLSMEFTHAQVTYYLSPSGNDQWTGKSKDVDSDDGPLASLSAVLVKVRAESARSGERDFHIIMRSGVYTIDKPIEISEKDQFGISFEAYPGEKPVISAGKKITGWKSGKVNGKACWKVNLPEVKSGDVYFRQLFVNGKRANRPRLPETGFYEVEDPMLGDTGTQAERYNSAARDRFIFREGDIKKWKNLQDVNVMVLHYWQEDYLPVSEVNTSTREVNFSAKSYYPFLRSHPAHMCNNAWYYVDNVFEALDSPGEWYLERSTGDMYYIPRPGEKIHETEIYAPVLTQILRIEGSQDKKLSGFHFKGLEFRHSGIVWDAHYGTGNNFSASGPALIRFNSVKDCSVLECMFTNLGEYAIEILGRSENVYITGNRFEDLGSGAIKMNDCDHVYITDNEIHSGGRIFHGTVAVLAHNTKYCRFLHNHISDFYFNGITVIGGRKSLFVGAPGCYDNLIMKNHIHNMGQGWLSDMGGIKIAGLQPGMIISGNMIHDIQSACYGGNAVYLDATSQHIIVEQNLLYNTNNVIVNVKGIENVIRNNILAFGGQSLIRRACPFPSEMRIANVYKNIMLVNDTYVHRTRHEIPVFTPGYWSDLNLIWNLGEKPLEVEQPFNYGNPSLVAGFSEWIEKTGNDRHSIIRDPLLRDPLNGDFSLSNKSIAHKLGINPGTFNDVGPRPKDEWEITKIRSVAAKVSTEGHIE